jgi:hypothetical protein
MPDPVSRPLRAVQVWGNLGSEESGNEGEGSPIEGHAATSAGSRAGGVPSVPLTVFRCSFHTPGSKGKADSVKGSMGSHPNGQGSL